MENWFFMVKIFDHTLYNRPRNRDYKISNWLHCIPISHSLLVQNLPLVRGSEVRIPGSTSGFSELCAFEETKCHLLDGERTHCEKSCGVHRNDYDDESGITSTNVLVELMVVETRNSSIHYPEMEPEENLASALWHTCTHHVCHNIIYTCRNFSTHVGHLDYTCKNFIFASTIF